MLLQSTKLEVCRLTPTLCFIWMLHLNCAALEINERPTDPDQVELKWKSETGKHYTVQATSDLSGNFSNLAVGQQATPPMNYWWVPTNLADKRFFKLVPNETDSNSQNNLLLNGDFSNQGENWSLVANSTETEASFQTENNEIGVEITDGGTNLSHIFLRQLNIQLEAGKTYTLAFDARVENARPIRITLRDDSISQNYLTQNITLSNTGTMQSYRFEFAAGNTGTSLGRLTFLLGNDANDIYFDNIYLLEGTPIINRAAAYAMNARLARGNNFMASKAMNSQGAFDDYELLNDSGFNHCRIGYKLDEVVGAAPDYLIPSSNLQNIQAMVDWCLQEGLIAVVDPVHNWGNNSDDTKKFGATTEEFNKLGKIWEQVADYFATYSLDGVVFEVFNEPHSDDNGPLIITTALQAIRASNGNEKRIVIVPGDGFSTRQAIIDAFDNNEIPTNDNYLIGTFHYYDPFTFTKQGLVLDDAAVAWGTTEEFSTVDTDFSAVATANNNWANTHQSESLPIYLGEFGVDNEADLYNNDRKRWLSWVRMQAERNGFSWAHWNMYQNALSSKGMGPWVYNQQIQNPETRSFDPDPLEALVGEYEFEDGTSGGNVSFSTNTPGFKGVGYAEFPTETGDGIFAKINNIYIPKDDTYAVKVHYASAATRSLRLVTRDDNGTTVQRLDEQSFPATGGTDSWATHTIYINFSEGDDAEFRVVALPDAGVHLDWIHITLP